MNTPLTIVDMRVNAGDSAYLLYNDTVSILYDTGFAFTGDALASKVSDVLGDRQLDYIFLTHSHYDHCLGAPYVLKRHPKAQVIAGEHTADVFSRAGAIRRMQELDQAHAMECGVEEYEFLGASLKVDIVVKDGERIALGDKSFVVIATPGHTKCCVALFEENERLLLSTETLGIYNGSGVLPIILVSFEDALKSMDKMLSLTPTKILTPHLGVIEGEALNDYLSRAMEDCIAIRDYIVDDYKKGLSRDAIIQDFLQTFLRDYVGDIYPPKAAYLNTSIMVDLVKKEYDL